MLYRVCVCVSRWPAEIVCWLGEGLVEAEEEESLLEFCGSGGSLREQLAHDPSWSDAGVL